MRKDINDRREEDCSSSSCYAEEFNKWHFLWMMPLVIFCSPIGIILWLKLYPDLWWTSATGLMIALCGCVANGIEDEGEF